MPTEQQKLRRLGLTDALSGGLTGTDGEGVQGIRFYEEDGTSPRDGRNISAGGVEVYGREVHLVQGEPVDSGEPLFEYTNLDAPTLINVGRQATIEADVENTGVNDGVDQAELIEDGEVVDTQEISLGVGQTTTVTFNRTYEEVQEVEVRISNTASQTIQVVA